MVQSRGGISVANRYRLLAELGYGPMGTVWRAHDDRLGRAVAVKELRLPVTATEADPAVFVERTLRTARATAQLGHPSIAEIYDVIVEHGRPWVVMELVPAPNLAQVVARSGPLPPDRVTDIARRLLDALGDAHNAGILHRDIKPSNVLLAEDGRVVLTDFAVADPPAVPGVPAAFGHIESRVPPSDHVAPEVARGEASTSKSDLWSLGAILYTAVEGHPPHERRGAAAAPHAPFTDEPQPPRLAGATLSSVIMGLLERNPAMRLTHARAADRLERATAPRSRRREAHRHRMLVAIALTGATCAIGLIGLGGLVLGMARERTDTVSAPGSAALPPPASAPASEPESVRSNALVIRADGAPCKIFVASPGNTEVVFDGVLAAGQVGQYDLPRLDAVIHDAAACEVWIHGRLEPKGRPGERKRFTVAEE
ncbi:serine/threonine-protein kinase [Actinomadura alba]|uniref:non-specific serine/threonine protein kinase n=1 Tax=Actinomadura alba TaxID=406431 RepID=A0ABR7LQK5_9ACTN|nr:serine/threonine-protein kinase [Actinomadura alba]MBC6467131.1 serine/threonine protein kinase [Actinomadura alba]